MRFAVPIGRVLHQFEPLARHEAIHLPRAGARGIARERVPRLLGALLRVGDARRHCVEQLLPLRGRGHVEVGEIDRQQRVGRGRGQLDGHLVDRLGAAQVRHARGRDADLAGVEMRCVLLQHLLDVPHHGVGVEVRAVVEFHARAQLEDPFGLVGRRDRPFGRDAGDHHARLVGGGEIPGGEALIHRVAGEAVALETLVGLADGLWNIRRRHADAHGLRRCGGHQRRQKPRCERRGGEPEQTDFAHCDLPVGRDFASRTVPAAAISRSRRKGPPRAVPRASEAPACPQIGQEETSIDQDCGRCRRS